MAERDANLIVAAQNGDGQAIDVLMRRYKGLVSGVARPFFLVGADYEDLMQEGMIGLFHAIDSYDCKSASFVTYARQCVRNRLLDAVKTANRDKHRALNDSVSLTLLTEGESLLIGSPEESAIAEESVRMLRAKIIEVLSTDEYRLLAAYLNGKSYRQIAAELNRSSKYVDNTLQKIKRKLRKFL